jgi:AcrR family transcriptional regulator
MSEEAKQHGRRASGQRVRKKAAVAQRILEVARAAFVTQGINDSDFGEIARQAGVGRATLYRYFDGKDALMRALVEQDREGQARLFERLVREPVMDGPTVESWLRRLIRAATASAASFPIYFALGSDVLMANRLHAQHERLMDILAQRFPAFARSSTGGARRERVDGLLLLIQIEQFITHVASGADPEEAELGLQILNERLLAFASQSLAAEKAPAGSR